MSKYKIGDKFIVEVEERCVGDFSNSDKGKILYRIKGFESLVFDSYGLDKLQKINPKLKIEDIDDMLAEHDLKKESYEKGLNDAWELARKVSHMCLDDMNKCFDLEDLDKYGADMMLYEHYTPQEALAKVEAYEESKAIKVGDVVRRISDNEEYLIITKEDDYSTYKYGVIVLRTTLIDRITGELSKFEKTGRHIDISSILEQIRGNE